MRKDEIETRNGRPAVNVKVYRSLSSVKLPLDMGSVSEDNGATFTPILSDPGFALEWVEENVSEDDLYGWERAACEDGWESLQAEAERVFPDYRVKVYAEGRSAGWAVVHGLPEVEGWDAIMVSRWGRFARFARAVTDDIPRSTLWLIYVNVYED